MIETALLSAALGVAGGLASGGLTAWITFKVKKIDQEVERVKLQVTAYDIRLLEQRLKDYRDLWQLTKPTSRQQIDSLDAKSAIDLARKLTDWYYSGGGMILSGDARSAFFRARSWLQTEHHRRRDDWVVGVIKEFSGLRTALCEDIDSRRKPTLLTSTDEIGEGNQSQAARLAAESGMQECQL
jgi:hypothetical protein